MEIPVIMGGYKEIIPATPEGAEYSWYTNDHSFIRGKNGQWHCYAINNPRMDDLYREHPYLLHATSESITGPWSRVGFAIDESGDTRYVGAPFAFRQKDSQYLMIFEAMWDEKRGLEIARSDDLVHWTRDRKEVITNQPAMRRDPCVLRDDDRGDWLIYLCSPHPLQSQITLCRTSDFVTLSQRSVTGLTGPIRSPRCMLMLQN